MSKNSINNYYIVGSPFSNDWKTSSINRATIANPLTYSIKRGDGSTTTSSDNIYFNTVNGTPIANTTGISNIVTDTRKYPNFKETSTTAFKLYYKNETTLIADFTKSGSNWNIIPRSGTAQVTKLSQGLLSVVNSFIIDNVALNATYNISEGITFYKVDIMIRNTSFPTSICHIHCPYVGLSGSILAVTSDSDYYFA